MAEILQRTGSWTFDGDTLRIVPGSGKQVQPLRKSLGEVAVPLAAISGISFEPGGRKPGRLRLRMRRGADPVTEVAGTKLPDASDPYQLPVERDRSGAAEYLADEVRYALLLEQVPVNEPCDRFLLPGPAIPITANGTDGSATFDGEHVQLTWNWMAEDTKTTAGSRKIALDDLRAVEWTPAIGLEHGSVRIHPVGDQPALKPEHDPNCLLLWGIRQARETSDAVLFAAAVTACLPHPHAPTPESAPTGEAAQPKALEDGGASGEEHDVLLRRLEGLARLHRGGVLTDEEFSAAKQAVLSHF
ncbi:DUF4429 domain-containing protein [Streptomyces sp. AJS327]|uniref:DUF4429 domain-containing protein n=1 Tax=Streptomyces sp. AJS327 TaxID=2545265 RepID=UPI0015DFE282|nr:DUF4429 domain-containing protein [Streptomyces sp. AJS327]MBA0049671.1 DUF4429 domain-containing protein [Streptomyces sp. AJS327]